MNKRRDSRLYGTHPATGARTRSYSDDSHKLKNTRGEITAGFPRAEAEDNIQDAFSISGDADFILKVVAENLEQLSQFVTERLLSYNFIGHIKSYIVLKKLKNRIIFNQT